MNTWLKSRGNHFQYRGVFPFQGQLYNKMYVKQFWKTTQNNILTINSISVATDFYKTAQLDFSLNGFCFWLVKPFKRKSSLWWSEQNFCRSLQACSHFVIEMFELETAQCPLTWLTLTLLMLASRLSCSTISLCCWICWSFLSWGNMMSLVLGLKYSRLSGEWQCGNVAMCVKMLTDQSPGRDWDRENQSAHTPGIQPANTGQSFSQHNKLSATL